MSQAAELRFSWQFDSSGAQVVDRLTGAVQKLDKAQGEYVKKLDAAKKVLLENAQIAKDMSEYQIGAVRQSALGRANQTAAMRAAGLGANGLTVQEEAGMVAAAQRRAAEVKAEVARINRTGATDSGPGIGGVLSQLPGAGRFAALGGAAPIAGAVGIGVAGMEMRARLADLEQSTYRPWQTVGQVNTRLMGEVPVVGGWMSSLARERMQSAQHAADRVYRDFAHGHQLQRESSVFGMMREMGFNPGASIDPTRNAGQHFSVAGSRWSADLAAEQSRQVVMPTTMARGTAQERLQYREGQTMWELSKREESARVELVRSTERLSGISKSREENAKRVQKLETTYYGQMAAYRMIKANSKNSLGMEVDTPEVQNAFSQANRTLQELQMQREQGLQLGREEGEATIGRDTASAKLRTYKEGGTEWLQARLGIVSQQEDTARQQAYRLGMGGPQGRARAQMLKEMVEQNGFDILPGSIKSEYAQWFPEDAEAKAVAAGKGYGKGFGPMYNKDYDSTVREKDQIVKKLEEQSKQNLVDIAEIVSTNMEEQKKLIEQLATIMAGKQLGDAIQKIMENSLYNR